MRKILIASHGKMASGLKNTLEIFLGETDSITAVDAYVDSTSDYLVKIEEFIEQADQKNDVIFTDIMGGSVNQQVIALMAKLKSNLYIVSSMNLPVVLSVVLAGGELTKDKIMDILADCTPVLVEVNANSKDDEETFFE